MNVELTGTCQYKAQNGEVLVGEKGAIVDVAVDVAAQLFAANKAAMPKASKTSNETDESNFQG